MATASELPAATIGNPDNLALEPEELPWRLAACFFMVFVLRRSADVACTKHALTGALPCTQADDTVIHGILDDN